MPPRFSVAPMMGRTDRHFRRILRMFTRAAWLYTPMIHASAMRSGRAEAMLRFDPVELPLVLQLGGSDPRTLAACAVMAQERGFAEINLNCGCPSPAANEGTFGARLMTLPERVGECVAAMVARVRIPVTVKHRIGVDDHDSEASLHRFVDVVTQAGCRRFIVHARKAWLSGLDPAQNRSIPPLRYDVVSRLAQARPELAIELNGGLTTLDAAVGALRRDPRLAGVMVGRAIAQRPWTFAHIDACFGDAATPPPLRAVMAEVLAYAERECAAGEPLIRVLRPALGLTVGAPGGRAFRRRLAGMDARVREVAPLREAIAVSEL